MTFMTKSTPRKAPTMTREQPPASNPTTTGLLALLSNAFRSDATRASKITQGITGTFLLALITLSFTAPTAGAAQTRVL